MAEPFASVAEFLGRFDERFVAQLTSADGQTADETRVAAALDDASAELRGYLGRIPADKHPDAETLRVHAIKVATYLLAQNRPGKEFESIRNGYTDTIAFYKGLVDAAEQTNAAATLGVSSSGPCPTFNRYSLKGLVP